MDGTRSVAVLVGVLARATGSLSPDRVTRVVADLAANRMLDELPVNAFAGVRRIKTGRRRVRRRLLDAARGRRMVLGDVDALIGVLYRAGGRFLFTKPAAVVAALLSLVGGLLFLRAWAGGTTSLFLQSGSYATGGLILLALNVVALLAHELGHALATKHAGRRVPAVGVLLYFGIPSAFVDTTDIWMASRKHRLIATAAGPASALTLAGTMQILAFAVPGLAPLAFKLSFAWYLNALFNLNPLMALDGYYLAMDALEINNLRSRGIAFLAGTVRTRRVRWASLDRESRYVAAYGVAAALWTVVFVCVSTRIWRDRVSGLVAGLWHTGPGGKVLVLLFLAGLFAPILSGLGGVASRRLARRRARREATRGATARVDALRASRLAALPAPVLDRLAAAASWVPLAGARPVLSAGVLPSAVLVVVAGDLEARRPGDPPATVRLRAGAGDVIGVAEVTAGRAVSLEWRTTGDARLLGVPAGVFREATEGLLAPPGVDVHAAEAALDASPVLAALTPQARGELVSRMASVDVPPGKAVTVADPAHAVLVGAGVLATAEGAETRAGDVLRAEADDRPVRVTTRTRATLWRLPGFGELGAAAFATASAAPRAGAHGGGGHPPVTPPPTPSPGGDDEADDRLWRRTRKLLALLLLLALLSICAALADPVPWSEVPGDRVLVLVTRGNAETVVDGRTVRLARRGRVTLGAGDRVEVERRSTVHLVYAGGAEQVLCGGSHATVLSVSRSRSGRTFAASGGLLLERGALLADTEPATRAYDPLDLRVESARLRAQAATGEPARFGVTVGRVDVESGDVTIAGDAAEGPVDCRGAGDDGVVPLPGPSPVPSDSPSPSTSPSQTPTPSAPASPTGVPTVTSAPPPFVPPPPVAPTTAPPTTAAPTVTPTPTPTVLPTPTPTVRPPGDIRWACAPTAFTVQAGGAGSSRCTATSVDGYAGGISFACLDEPAGMTCDPSPPSATLTPGSAASTTFTVSTGSTPPPGTYDIRAVVTSADFSIVRSVTLRVTVS